MNAPVSADGDMRRADLVAAFESRYRRAEAGAGCCVYCGRKASILDHVPALARASSLPASTPHVLYPACRWCNDALGPHPATCLRVRAEFVANMREADFQHWRLDVERFSGFEDRSNRAWGMGSAAGPVAAQVRARLAGGLVELACQCGRHGFRRIGEILPGAIA